MQHVASADTARQGDAARPQHPLWLSVVLSLAPGLALGAFIILTAPLFERVGLDPIFALFGGIGLVIVPIELGILAVVAHRTTGSWSPLAALDYTTKLPARRLVPLAIGLAIWFIATLIVWIATVEEALVDALSPWVPATLLQFAQMSAEGELPSAGVIVALLGIAFLFNGFIGPVTEELYFRGYLLPRIDRFGRWAPVLNSVLFAVYHVWTPWRWPQIVIGFVPIAVAGWRTRSLYVPMLAHVIVNVVFLVLLMSALLAG